MLSGGYEAAVTARVRIGWVTFRIVEFLLENRFLLKIKGKVYCCCIRSKILNGNETRQQNRKVITVDAA